MDKFAALFCIGLAFTTVVRVVWAVGSLLLAKADRARVEAKALHRQFSDGRAG